MKCPHCLVAFHDKPAFEYIGKDDDGFWGVLSLRCAACQRIVIFLQGGADVISTMGSPSRIAGLTGVFASYLVRPKGTARPPVPSEVPDGIASDYREACLVLADSPKASAALSRRCLQHVLREAANVKPGDLASEIQQVLDSRMLPTSLADSIDAVRNVGNFSAHPMKSKHTGEVLPVEPQEAEWNLDVLEALFDFYYVQPAVIAKKRAALNAKLSTVGKPPLKQ